MCEGDLRSYFANVQDILHIKIGIFCDRNGIYRSDFSNFMKGKKYFVSLHELELMKDDINDHVKGFLQLYEKIE